MSFDDGLFAIDEKRAKASLELRAFYRWMLEFIRNTMVLAAIAFLAVKSGSYLLWGVAAFTGLFLCGFCYTYIDSLRASRNLSEHGRAGKIAWWSITLGIEVLMLGISAAMFFAIDTIVSVQLGK